MVGIRAIIFDFDGVIVESADIKTEAFVTLFAEWPQHREAIRDYHLAHQGISRYAKFEWIYRELLRQPLTASESARLGAAFSEIVFNRVLQCPFVPGAVDLLRALHGRMPLFVASGTPVEELEDIIDRRGLADYFDEVWGAPTEKSTAVRSVLARLALQPQQVLFVGDAISDRNAAVETDVRFIARHTEETLDTWRGIGVESVADLKVLHMTLDHDGLLQPTAVAQEQV